MLFGQGAEVLGRRTGNRLRCFDRSLANAVIRQRLAEYDQVGLLLCSLGDQRRGLFAIGCARFAARPEMRGGQTHLAAGRWRSFFERDLAPLDPTAWRGPL